MLTREMKRILDLPVDNRTGEEFVEKWTEHFRQPGGTWKLHPHQALALEYASQGLGPFLPITVGGGKTIIGQLLPEVLGVDPEDVIVLCPAPLVAEAASEYEHYRQQFRVSMPRYVSYHELSRDHTLLDRLAPKAIVADEAHKLKNPKAARTIRFLKYMRAADPTPKFVAMSATFSSASIMDYPHLMYLALGKEQMCLPNAYPTLQAWSRCIDLNPQIPAGKDDFAQVAILGDRFAPDEDTLRSKIRVGFGRRMASTPGIVVTDGDSCDKPLYVKSWKPELPEVLTEAIRCARGFVMPNGDIIDNPMHLSAKIQQLAMGFFYFWDWPGEPDMDWIYTRRDWNRAVEAFRSRRRKGLDTPMLIERWVETGQCNVPWLQDVWDAWYPHKDKPEPPQGVEWITDEMLLKTLDYAEDGTLIWTAHQAVADRMRDLGAEVYESDERPTGGRTCVVRTRGHSTGLNLQYEWSRNLVTSISSNGGLWQQMLGRTHRNGQKADAVYVEYLATPRELASAYRKAVKSARWIEENQNLTQKLCNALDIS